MVSSKALKRVAVCGAEAERLDGPCVWTVLSVLKLVLAVVVILLARKVYQGQVAMRFVSDCHHTVAVQTFLDDPEFKKLTTKLRASEKTPAIFFLNKYALNMTLNWLCNTANLEGVHERAVMVSMDEEARYTLQTLWPHVTLFHRPNHCLQDSFGFGDGAYQLFFVFRNNFALALVKSGLHFWMMQQDTVWRENVLAVPQVQNATLNSDHDIVFDRLGFKDSSRSQWINGANYFVRATPNSERFFAEMEQTLVQWYVPDVSVMIHKCAVGHAQCGYFPFSMVSCWEWLYYGDQSQPPYIIQMDAESNCDTKLRHMERMGFYFMESDGQTCSPHAVHKARHNLAHSQVDLSSPRSIARMQFTFYWIITELLLLIPYVGVLLRTYLPLVGYYLMMTM